MDRIELIQKWIEFQKENPPKIDGQLEHGEQRCCLGNLCYIAKKFGEIEDYNGKNVFLSSVLAKKVGITSSGRFNRKGVKLVREICGTGWRSLVELNDFTGLSHAEIGEIIEMLFKEGGFIVRKNR